MHIHVGHLDGLEIAYGKGRTFLSFPIEIINGDYAPDTAHEQLIKFLDYIGGDLNPADSQIEKKSLRAFPAFIKGYSDFIDDLEAAPLPDTGFDLFSFIRADIILGQDVLDAFNAVLNDILIV